LHVGAEHAALHRRVPRASRLHQEIEQAAPLLGGRRPRKPRPQPVTGICRKRKLRHEKQISLDLPQTQIHLVGFIGENPVIQQPLREFRGARLIVLGPDADEHEQTAADGGMRLTGDFDAGTADALQERDQELKRLIEKSVISPYFWILITT
jgi:hypothetical protein